MASDLSSKEAEIYDRQIRLWGVEAQRRMRSSRVLLAGSFRALNAELCKNLVLAGISVTIQDDGVVSLPDVGAQFFITAADVGKSRAEASAQRVRELNPLVEIGVETRALESLSDDFFRAFSVVCCGDVPLPTQLRIDALCRSHPKKPIAFFATECFGMSASLFCDLGRHEYLKPAPKSKEGEAAGDTALAPEKVIVEFPSLADAVAAPWKPLNTHKRKRMPESFYALQVLQSLSEAGRRDTPLNSRDGEAEASETLFKLLEAQGLSVDICDTALVRRMVDEARAGTELAPICAVMGGIVGQEVIKAISCKDKPILNFFFFDGVTGAGVTRRVPKA